MIRTCTCVFLLLAATSIIVRADATGTSLVPIETPNIYPDHRPAAKFRLAATDAGIVLKHGDGPGGCDQLGARDIWVWKDQDTYYMHYDGAGPKGWLACLATSTDLTHWTKKGPVLDFGAPGSDDSASASYGTTYLDDSSADKTWYMFYLGTPHASPAPDFVPGFPYLTRIATAPAPTGPWTKQPKIIPFQVKPDTYYAGTASPGQIIKKDDEYLMFFSASASNPVKRTLSIARTRDLTHPWTIQSRPIVSIEEQVENTSLYFEPTNQTWFLFTNHIGLASHEFTDAIWVYWSQDLEHWDASHKAIVFDGTNCKWSRQCIGLPSVVQVGSRLAIFYDAPGGDNTIHMGRDVGLAWLDLPLNPSVPSSPPPNP